MAKKLTKQELIEKLKVLASDLDKERAHSEADDLLLAYINDKEVTEAFETIEKWYA